MRSVVVPSEAGRLTPTSVGGARVLSIAPKSGRLMPFPVMGVRHLPTAPGIRRLAPMLGRMSVAGGAACMVLAVGMRVHALQMSSVQMRTGMAMPAEGATAPATTSRAPRLGIRRVGNGKCGEHSSDDHDG